jgi:hypothetical protein
VISVSGAVILAVTIGFVRCFRVPSSSSELAEVGLQDDTTTWLTEGAGTLGISTGNDGAGSEGHTTQNFDSLIPD